MSGRGSGRRRAAAGGRRAASGAQRRELLVMVAELTGAGVVVRLDETLSGSAFCLRKKPPRRGDLDPGWVAGAARGGGVMVGWVARALVS